MASIMPNPDTLQDQFGTIDIYLFDQLLKGRVPAGGRVLDVGCHAGRNCHYLLKAGFDVHGIDADAEAIAKARRLAMQIRPEMNVDQFRVESLEGLSAPAESFDLVITIAVLHFAKSDTAFLAMLDACWRAVKPGGLFLCRLASNIGIEDKVEVVDGRVCDIPDGSRRYLVDEPMLLELTDRLGAKLLEPIKTTIVQSSRAMTTWVLGKG